MHPICRRWVKITRSDHRIDLSQLPEFLGITWDDHFVNGTGLQNRFNGDTLLMTFSHLWAIVLSPISATTNMTCFNSERYAFGGSTVDGMRKWGQTASFARSRSDDLWYTKWEFNPYEKVVPPAEIALPMQSVLCTHQGRMTDVGASSAVSVNTTVTDEQYKAANHQRWKINCVQRFACQPQ